jgi:zinc transport system ATP-binding protein
VSAAETLLELSAVDLVRGRRHLLEGVDLQVRRAEIVTLIGPNGAGKTTLLRIALGLLPQTSGKVYRKPGITVGYMPQRLQIDPTFPLQVKRFLAMAGGEPERARSLLEQVGAPHVYESPLQNISGGEMQRVLLARALIRNPDLLVLDEPVQGVDMRGQVELYRLISAIRLELGCAVLMVSHDLHLVMAATDRVLCLNRHICCSGTPEVVTLDPAYLELFGHLAVYTHDPSHNHSQHQDTPGEADDK